MECLGIRSRLRYLRGDGASLARNARRLYAIRLLRPWHASIAKRQVKTPKVYLRDSGMLYALLGINSLGELMV